MKKICHMTSAHPAGDVRIFHKECVSLARAGYEVYLVQRGESGEEQGVHLVGIGEIPSGRIARMTKGAKAVYQKALEVDADLYHFHDPELLPYALKLKRRGKKVVFDSHEMYTEQIRNKAYLPGWCAKLIAGVYGAFQQSVLRRIDGLVFPCLKNGKHPFAGQCARVITLDNLPMLHELYDRYDPAAEKEPGSIVHVGSLTYPRGITHMVRAGGAAGCKVILAGVFSPASYQAEVEALPEYACVEYLGKQDRDGVRRALQRGCVGMATLLNVGQYNQYDNLATKVYEYMSLGLPVVLTRSAYNQQVMDRLQFGVCVDPENVEEIAAAVRYLLDHPDEARVMGENGRRAVKEVFNWDEEVKKLLSLYEEILKD